MCRYYVLLWYASCLAFVLHCLQLCAVRVLFATKHMLTSLCAAITLSQSSTSSQNDATVQVPRHLFVLQTIQLMPYCALCCAGHSGRHPRRQRCRHARARCCSTLCENVQGITGKQVQYGCRPGNTAEELGIALSDCFAACRCCIIFGGGSAAQTWRTS